MPLYLPTGSLTGRNINVKEILTNLNDSNTVKKIQQQHILYQSVSLAGFLS